MKKKIFQIDAFTDRYFGGNPAGVVTGAVGLSEEDMRKIAKEMNLSETAFVFESREEGYDYEVRFFTPTQEVDLCGHATIATFYALWENNKALFDSEKVIYRQKTKAGILPVELNFLDKKLESVMMTQTTPSFYDRAINLQELAIIMGLNIEDIGIEGRDVAPMIVSTGLPDIMLPVKNLSSLKKIKPNLTKLATLSNELGVTGVHAFTMETEEDTSDLSCRNFAPAAGIDEEAATGTSNGALGAYLIKNDILSFTSPRTIVCEQGYYMDRPSKIIVKVEGTSDNMLIKVGGKAVVVLEGTIRLGPCLND